MAFFFLLIFSPRKLIVQQHRQLMAINCLTPVTWGKPGVKYLQSLEKLSFHLGSMAGGTSPLPPPIAILISFHSPWEKSVISVATCEYPRANFYFGFFVRAYFNRSPYTGNCYTHLSGSIIFPFQNWNPEGIFYPRHKRGEMNSTSGANEGEQIQWGGGGDRLIWCVAVQSDVNTF